MNGKKLHIGLSLSPTWLSGDAWRRRDSRVGEIFDSDLYVDLARRSEDAKLDFVFKPDSQFLDPVALSGGPGFSSLDPMILLATLARETSRIGLVSTASTTFLPPYAVARQLQSLNRVSGGRAGWNIVTSLDGQANFGLADMPSSQERYARAAEVTSVVQKLWASYPHDALRVDRDNGVYADPSAVGPVDHVGEFLSVAGPLTVPEPASGQIPLFQAGSSPEGREFAATVADAVFAATPDVDAGIELRNDLGARAERLGRTPDSLVVMPGLSMFLAPTSAHARELHRETHARMSRERKFTFVEATLGIDLRGLDPDGPVPVDDLPDPNRPVRSRTHAELVRRMVLRDRPTVAELLERPEIVASAHWVVVGTADDAVAQIVERAEKGAMDGFIALPGGSWGSLGIFFDEVVPRLVERGLFRAEYSGTTLREHLTTHRTAVAVGESGDSPTATARSQCRVTRRR
ncbi:FMN-dependent oxidoreductase (nitrilotriacetate monooxygenase family) [Rhodococcus sp. SMB37]|uniref:NtaA/DmoA family FMN-dependent monooxygenase n=1 Tax=Rhodococcus sp. SMB37 TaxID=2512213 RepID=UPI00104A6972|nr:NtaA/DmoA family FMN-dependent monooxygenase [Rhodococcus sp. SMB37]TCN45883.1 FMN-dependent oxidoreductase (nitrilotriacetate monooxygenase family) [Rhodococcus sp. SMB37]